MNGLEWIFIGVIIIKRSSELVYETFPKAIPFFPTKVYLIRVFPEIVIVSFPKTHWSFRKSIMIVFVRIVTHADSQNIRLSGEEISEPTNRKVSYYVVVWRGFLLQEFTENICIQIYVLCHDLSQNLRAPLEKFSIRKAWCRYRVARTTLQGLRIARYCRTSNMQRPTRLCSTWITQYSSRSLRHHTCGTYPCPSTVASSLTIPEKLRSSEESRTKRQINFHYVSLGKDFDADPKRHKFKQIIYILQIFARNF